MKLFHRGATLYLALLATLWSRAAPAHSPGISQSDFTVQPDGTVEAEIVLAQAEPLSNIVLDKNYDGKVSDDELVAAHDELQRLMVQGIEVDAGGRVCRAEFRGAELTEGDGLRLRASYKCRPDVERIGVTLFFLSDLKGMKHAARITREGASIQKLLGPTNRYIALDLPPEEEDSAPREGKHRVDGWRRSALVVTTVVFVAFMTGLFVWRWRRKPRLK